MNKKSHIFRNIFLTLIVIVTLIIWGIGSLIGWAISAIEDEEGTKTNVEKMEDTFFSSEDTSEEVYNEYYEDESESYDYSENESYSDATEINSKGFN